MDKIGKFLILLITISLFVFIIEMSSNSFAQSSLLIPSWIKNDAREWSQGQISDNDFENGIQYMIQNEIIKIPHGQNVVGSYEKIPSWIRNVAGWWAKDEVGDNDFVNLLQWLVDNKILSAPQSQQSNNMNSSSSQIMVATFAPPLNSDLLSVLDKHKTDFGINFRLSNLLLYDSQQRILLGFSSDSVQKAIQQANNSSAQIQYVGYDNEPNNANLSTPPNEVADPAAFTNLLSDSIHNAGFKYAITPSRDLLQAEYNEVNWTKVDLIVIQMQRLTSDETQYHSYLDPIVSYIKTKNADTLILVQVNPKFDSISHIASVIQNTKRIDGVSIVVTTASTGDIDALLTAIHK